jgi:adenosylhomocysteine nucleosidase
MGALRGPGPVVVIISANVEWEAARPELAVRFAVVPEAPTPYGEACRGHVGDVRSLPVIFTHGGWGKIDAAASAQYAIDRWCPRLLVNLGTCGGFAGAIERDTVVLAERTLVYDIVEQMSDPDAALEHYAVALDLSWLHEPFPHPVHRGLLLSGDRDLVAHEVPALHRRFGGVAGDWESGAIAHVAARNGARCLILRSVTDLVGPEGGEAYDGTLDFFRARAQEAMVSLLAALPAWLSCVEWGEE